MLLQTRALTALSAGLLTRNPPPASTGLPTRRNVLAGAGATLFAPAALVRAPPQVVVVGGGFGGATCARELARFGIGVTLVESSPFYTACPASNAVIAGNRELAAQQFDYAALERAGVRLAKIRASQIDANARMIHAMDGATLSYDRLVLAPGIDFRFDAIAGYDEAATQIMPHAWKAGAQTLLLRDQLRTMQDGGTFIISAPAGPHRCPPAPYERASLVADYFLRQKPKSKILILDAKDSFPHREDFLAAWKRLYGSMIEWVPLSSSGNVIAVDIASKILTTDFDSHPCDVANIIPPQKAGAIAQQAGVTDRSGWCPVAAASNFQSTLVPGIHIIGDAMSAGTIPRSASAAHSEGKACAAALAAVYGKAAPATGTLASTCYASVSPQEAFSIRGNFAPQGDGFAELAGSTGTAPTSPELRAQEAVSARDWFKEISHDIFG